MLETRQFGAVVPYSRLLAEDAEAIWEDMYQQAESDEERKWIAAISGRSPFHMDWGE